MRQEAKQLPDPFLVDKRIEKFYPTNIKKIWKKSGTFLKCISKNLTGLCFFLADQCSETRERNLKKVFLTP